MTSSRRACRSGRPCEPRNLAEAIYCALHHSNLDIGVIAERMGVRRTYLYEAGNPDRDDMQFQARLLVPLMAATGNLAPLRLLARAFGAALIKLPAPSDDRHQDLRASFLRVVKELGEDSGEIERALSDDRISSDEAARVVREMSETIEALVAVRMKFEAYLPAKQERA